MKVSIPVVAAVALLMGAVAQVRAGTVLISPSARGWINDGSSGANGNDALNNYIAGRLQSAGNYRDHFDFAIPCLSGTLGATLTLTDPDHEGAPTTYAIYSLGVFGTYGFSDIGTGTLYGSASISAFGTVSITLDSAALAVRRSAAQAE